MRIKQFVTILSNAVTFVEMLFGVYKILSWKKQKKRKKSKKHNRHGLTISWRLRLIIK